MRPYAAYGDALLGWAGIAAGATPESLDARPSAIALQVKAAIDWPRIRALAA